MSGLISATISHFSCHSFQDVAKALIKHGADVNRQLSAGKDKVTPLMLACQNGNLDIARLLVQHKAQVEQKGKITPLKDIPSILKDLHFITTINIWQKP